MIARTLSFLFIAASICGCGPVKYSPEVEKKVGDDIKREELEKNGFTPAQTEAAFPKPKQVFKGGRWVTE